MAEISRLSGHRDWIDLDFVERERTPESAMALGIQSHVAGLSLSNTVELLEDLGVQHSRKAVHDWVQKADLQPEPRKSPNQIALDETVIRINNQQFWLYAAADPQSNELLHVRLFATTTTTLTEIFSARTSPKTQCRNCRLSRRWRSTPPNRTATSRTSISYVSPQKSERYRTDFSRTEASNLVVFTLLQSRRPGNRRKLVAELRSMAQCY